MRNGRISLMAWPVRGHRSCAYEPDDATRNTDSPTSWTSDASAAPRRSVRWAKEQLGIEMDLVDSVEPTLVAAITAMCRRLRREFLEEPWS